MNRTSITAYILELLYVRAYYAGFCTNFSGRLTEHILGDGPYVTRRLGVSRIIFNQEFDSIETAKETLLQEEARMKMEGAVFVTKSSDMDSIERILTKPHFMLSKPSLGECGATAPQRGDSPCGMFPPTLN